MLPGNKKQEGNEPTQISYPAGIRRSLIREIFVEDQKKKSLSQLPCLQSEELLKAITKKFGISKMQGYRDVNYLVKEGKLIRYPINYPLRKVLYGLTESIPLKDNGIDIGLSYVKRCKEFADYRAIFEKLMKLATEHPLDLEELLTQLCTSCKKQSGPDLSTYCNPCNEKLIDNIQVPKPIIAITEIEERNKSIIYYFAYNFKAELFLMVYHQLKQTLPTKDWEATTREQLARLHKLSWTDSSLEPKLERWFPRLLESPDEDAEKVIRLTMNSVRWHQIDLLNYFNDEIYQENHKARLMFEEEGVPIVEALGKQPIINKKIASLYDVKQ